jgi:sec-independent protein translocase protein TatA
MIGGTFKLLIILLIVLLIFGAGKLPKIMGDLGKGIRSFKKGLSEGEDEVANAKQITAEEVEKK